jgi:hypothetical protein
LHAGGQEFDPPRLHQYLQKYGSQIKVLCKQSILIWCVQTFIKNLVKKIEVTQANSVFFICKCAYSFEVIEVIWSRREAQTVDALAVRGDEGRGILRKAMGSWKRALIHRCPNGGTRL